MDAVLRALANRLLLDPAFRTSAMSDSALGTMRSIEHTIQKLDDAACNLEQDIRDTRKRVTDVTAQCGQPFEYSERLAVLILRQQEIADALDLSKNQAASQLESEPAPDRSAPVETSAVSLREIGFSEYD